MYIVMFVLDDPQRLDEVLDAWHDIGVSGVTVLESSSRQRRRQVRPLGARYLFSAIRTVDNIERGQYTLYTIVPNLSVANQCQTVVEAIVGDLSGPDTGVLVAWELAHVKGVADQLQKPEADE